MTTFTINESGMTFGPFQRDECFEVEKCDTYKRIEHRVKVAEFIWLRPASTPPKMWIVEAKSSTPRPIPPERFAEFIHEIHDKLVNALSMVLSACLKRPDSAHPELPASFNTLALSTVDPRFILVVHGHKPEWLGPLQDALSQSLAPTVKTWGITTPAIVVMNDDMARQYNLIQ